MVELVFGNAEFANLSGAAIILHDQVPLVAWTRTNVIEGLNLSWYEDSLSHNVQSAGIPGPFDGADDRPSSLTRVSRANIIRPELASSNRTVTRGSYCCIAVGPSSSLLRSDMRAALVTTVLELS